MFCQTNWKQVTFSTKITRIHFFDFCSYTWSFILKCTECVLQIHYKINTHLRFNEIKDRKLRHSLILPTFFLKGSRQQTLTKTLTTVCINFIILVSQCLGITNDMRANRVYLCIPKGFQPTQLTFLKLQKMNNLFQRSQKQSWTMITCSYCSWTLTVSVLNNEIVTPYCCTVFILNKIFSVA